MTYPTDCADCGYPRAKSVRPAGESRCTNPWCPDDPGSCPECGRRGPHQVMAFVGVRTQLHCSGCGADWIPAPHA